MCKLYKINVLINDINNDKLIVYFNKNALYYVKYNKNY